MALDRFAAAFGVQDGTKSRAFGRQTKIVPLEVSLFAKSDYQDVFAMLRHEARAVDDLAVDMIAKFLIAAQRLAWLPSLAMNAVPENSAARRDWLRPLRYLVRVPALIVHVLIAPWLAIFVFSPLGVRFSVGGERLDHWATRWWSGALIRRFGFRIRRIGEPLPGPTLFVANHVSWMDIELMHSQRMMSFVAKREIARWPFVGWLATRAGTIYHQRGSTHSLTLAMEAVVARLGEGGSAGVFPEGGTGPGDCVRTFHARIFQAAVDARVPIQPVALCYGKNGKMDSSVPFAAQESFFGNFVRLLGGPSLDAEVHFLEPIEFAGEGRREIAEAARSRIAAALGCE